MSGRNLRGCAAYGFISVGGGASLVLLFQESWPCVMPGYNFHILGMRKVRSHVDRTPADMMHKHERRPRGR